jgi:hypothetical protein
MEEVPVLPAEVNAEEVPESKPERLMEIVIRVCDQYAFLGKKERPHPGGEIPKR